MYWQQRMFPFEDCEGQGMTEDQTSRDNINTLPTTYISFYSPCGVNLFNTVAVNTVKIYY